MSCFPGTWGRWLFNSPPPIHRLPCHHYVVVYKLRTAVSLVSARKPCACVCAYVCASCVCNNNTGAAGSSLQTSTGVKSYTKTGEPQGLALWSIRACSWWGMRSVETGGGGCGVVAVGSLFGLVVLKMPMECMLTRGSRSTQKKGDIKCYGMIRYTTQQNTQKKVFTSTIQSA